MVVRIPRVSSMSTSYRSLVIAVGMSLTLGLHLQTRGLQTRAILFASPPPPPDAPAVPAASDVPGSTTIDFSRSRPEKVMAEHLPNPWRLHPKVISGGLPSGEAAFQELAELGVRTLISVDGAKPDVELARKYGLRYVHLPHGYDGVPEGRAKELAKAVRDLPGPIYIHCHHGKHRSPAAATVACVGAGLLSPDHARGMLQVAGTSENYRGLYQSAQSAKLWDAALLDGLRVNFSAVAVVPPVAEAMIAMEQRLDHLQTLAATRWQSSAGQADLDPVHEALLLREHSTELLRTDEVRNRPEGFRELMIAGEAAARQLEVLLADWKRAGSPSHPPEAVDRALAAVTQSCIACHRAYRDTPLTEKESR